MRRVKLYNFSTMPSRELRALLEHAAKEAGCDGPVVTKINRGGRRPHGLAERGDWVCKWYISRRPNGRNGHLKLGTVHTRRGYVTIWPFSAADPLICAENLYKTAVHEYAHVADLQQRKQFGQYNRQWANRPHEQRAITAATFGMLKRDRKRDDLILALGIAIEHG